MKGKSIELSQMSKTALKISTDDPQYILGSYGYISGRHYFEINLLKFFQRYQTSLIY